MADYKDYSRLEAQHNAELELAKLGWYKDNSNYGTLSCLYCGCSVRDIYVMGNKLTDTHRKKCESY